jgi:hypothetical protein
MHLKRTGGVQQNPASYLALAMLFNLSLIKGRQNLSTLRNLNSHIQLTTLPETGLTKFGAAPIAIAPTNTAMAWSRRLSKNSIFWP